MIKYFSYPLFLLSILINISASAQQRVKRTLPTAINRNTLAKRPVPVSLDKQAKENIQRCWLANQSRLSVEKSGMKKEGNVYYQEYDRGWIITDGQYTFPVTGYILEKFKETGGIAKNGVPLEMETNKRLDGTNLNYQVFSKICFWGCGMFITRVEPAFLDKLKADRPLENTSAYKCPTGTAPISNSIGTVLLFQNKTMAFLPGNSVIELDRTDKLYLKWGQLGFINSRLGCPLRLDTKFAANSSQVISRTLFFERGSIIQTGMPVANETIEVKYN